MKQTNINLNQLNSIISTIVEEKMDTKTELKNAYDQLKRAKTALRGKGKKHGELKELTKALRKAADEIMELDDAATDEVRENEESEVVGRNEKSKGHGKYFGIEENKKTKVVKLKEYDLRNVIRRVIAEQEDTEDRIQGISTSLLHPITQKWIGGTKNVFQMILMMSDCHWKGSEINTDHPTEIVKPANYGWSGDDIVLDAKSDSSGQGAKFCFRTSGGQMVCFNPCKLGPNASSWSKSMRSGEFDAMKDEIVPIISRILEGSHISNGYADADDDATMRKYDKGGQKFGWRANGNGIGAKFKLTKI